MGRRLWPCVRGPVLHIPQEKAEGRRRGARSLAVAARENVGHAGGRGNLVGAFRLVENHSPHQGTHHSPEKGIARDAVDELAALEPEAGILDKTHFETEMSFAEAKAEKSCSPAITLAMAFNFRSEG